MALFKRFGTVLAGTALMATAAFAASHMDPAAEKAVKARQSHMTLYAFNIGTLGGMAQDKMPYDAEAAGRAAENLAALASLDQAGYWVEGTDAGSIEGTKAKAEIWSDMPEFEEHIEQLATATTALAENAGTDLDSLKASFGDVGKACGSCHEEFRVSDK
ncbi:Cytochrome c556 [Loktanella atrilutea]|uniref:Cytochrome c556 n=1 Tax=Loktanella atrilutea TaxID=366533 RepID=A0A1M4YCZ3_LOKAT|nr:cytochrome c [Loktanella atrilutea]SHF03607.1 Cytochrome c556 [Loktanella atrilutea]